jgi:hypothetical protein
MSLPEQIQKQVDDANRLIEQHYGTGAQEGTPGEPATPPNPETTPSGSEAPASVDETATTHSPTQEVTPADDENSPTYAQRWRSLQGIVASLNQKLSGSEQRVAQLEQLIATMSTPPAQPAVRTNLVTAQDTETFGEDMVDFAKRAAQEATAPLVEHINHLEAELSRFRQVAPLVQKVHNDQVQSKEERFITQLSERVSDWERVDINPDFIRWLGAPDPMTGILRQTYLLDARRALDVGRVAHIINSWKEQSGGTSAPQPRSKPNPASSELERQVAPGRVTAGAPPSTPVEGRKYTRQDVTKFYDDVRRGVFKGRDAERMAMEQDIFVAQREGRLV